MPPRRSGRQSLPTPANSTKSNDATSVGCTPGKNEIELSTLTTGMQTPRSLSDDGSTRMIDDDESDVKPNVDDKKRRRAALSADPDEGVFSETKSTSSAKPKYELSVELPSTRKKSRLATEKTTSADNLTLGSPVDKKFEGNSSGLMKEDTIDEEEEVAKLAFSNARGKRTTHAKHEASKEGQPFNIGTHSSVKKSTAADLALSADELDELDNIKTVKSAPRASKTAPKARAPRASKSKAKAQVKALDSSEDELMLKSESEEEEDGDFAMDSDEMDKQVQKAIKASKKTPKTARAGTSSAGTSSAASSSGRAKGGRAVKSGNLLRTAAAKAAQKRLGADSASSGEESVYTPDQQSTPAYPGETPDDSDLSELSAEDSDLSDFDEPLRAKGAGKGKGKAKAKAPRGGARFAGRGRKLGDGAEEDIKPRLDDSTAHIGYKERFEDETDEAYEQRCYRMYKYEKACEDRDEFKRQERIMKKELGRKLTNGEKNHIRLIKYHPELENVWGDVADKIVPVKPVPMEAHPSLKLTLLPFQKESLHWMKKQEEGPWKGGMLADEMGMGKTIQTIALLLSEPRRKPSMVVAPVVALMQWKHEIETHAEGFTVALWHGQGRMKAEELQKYDVVLSSYGTLEAAFRRQQRGFKKGNVFIQEQSPVHSFQWHRVILDEAHNIKERSTNAAKAAFALNAQYKWCLSGTPLQNRVGELYSLVRFLGADPFSHYFCKQCDCKSLHWQFKNNRECDQCGHTPMQHVCFWNSEILNPIARYGIEAGNPGHTSFKKLKILLDRMMLRRTKLERADDLGLPPRTIVVRRDYFSPEEKELYMSLFTGARRQFSTYVGAGTVLNNYSNIFSLITRMRQMACHPDLVLRGKTAKILPEAEEGNVCRLCNDQAEDAIMSQCKHVFDRECIRQYLEVQQMRGHRPECPVCHIEISIDLEAEAIDLGPKNNKARQGILSRLDLSKWRSSTKLEALVEELEKLRRNDSTTKSLVFSQFVSFLDLIAFRLGRAGFNICRLEGGMTPQQRDATIQHFMNNPGVTVFLISLKAGGVALNLTEASMVFMMDSWWNPSVEYQAMDRIHRLGQKRPVKVIKLVVEDSIEDQIVQLQHKKLAMTEAALSTDPDAALGKLTVEDLGFLFKM